jgi:hypothetical protein
VKSSEIEVGGTYLAKVGARSVEVRIDSENAKGGWNARSVASGKPVRIKDPKHLRPAKSADGAAGGEATTVVEADEGPGDGDLVPLSQLDREKKSAGRSKPQARAPKAAAAKAPKEKPAPKERKPKAMSALDAAAVVLKAAGGPMQCKAMVEAMASKGLWSTTAPTPAATLYSAILREITTKGGESRFKKTDRGHFALNAK